MKKEYIIEVRVNDNNRTFGEIAKQIMKMLITMDGVEGATIRSKE